MNDQIENRIVEMVFTENKNIVVNWLSKIIRGEVYCQNDVIYFRNDDINLTGGVEFRSDYTTKAVMLAFAIAGIQWPFFFPSLLEKVNKQWKKKSKPPINEIKPS
jgi:hypothetical protein